MTLTLGEYIEPMPKEHTSSLQVNIILIIQKEKINCLHYLGKVSK